LHICFKHKAYNLYSILTISKPPYNTKTLYNLLLDSDEHVIKIVERNVNIDYSVVFKNVFDKFIDTLLSQVSSWKWRISVENKNYQSK
jgi:hypothetical protein